MRGCKGHRDGFQGRQGRKDRRGGRTTAALQEVLTGARAHVVLDVLRVHSFPGDLGKEGRKGAEASRGNTRKTRHRGLAEVGPEFNHTSISAEPLNPRTHVCGDAGTSGRDQHPPTK